MEFFDGACHGLMKLATPLAWQGVVDRLLHQHMVKSIFRVWRRTLRDEESLSCQRRQILGEAFAISPDLC